MVGSMGQVSFSDDKTSFFSQIQTLASVEERSEQKEYSFLTQNRVLIEKEYANLFNALQKNGQNRDEFWLYCYYCCLLLKYYFLAYQQPAQAEKYQQLSQNIRHRCEHQCFPEAAPTEKNFLSSLKTKLAADFSELLSTPFHVSKVRDQISLTNLTRMQVVFSRLTLKSTLMVLHELHYLDKLLSPVSVDKLVVSFDKPVGLLNMLSVGVFAGRLAINVGMLLKHTFSPSEQEKTLTRTERFKQEWTKRHCDVINDIGWGLANGVTNYSAYFNLSASASNGIMSAFLLFDLSMLVYRQNLAKQDYLLKKSQYEEEKKSCQDETKLGILDEQLSQLNHQWQVSCATFNFNVVAAALFLGFYPVTFLLVNPVAAPIGFCMCIIAVSMYISSDAYGTYQDKNLLLSEAESLQDKAQALKARNSARRDFYGAAAKNAIVPTVTMAVFAVSWPAALALTIVYIGYERMKDCFPDSEEFKVDEALTPQCQR